jgi:hypothetical protein
MLVQQHQALTASLLDMLTQSDASHHGSSFKMC